MTKEKLPVDGDLFYWTRKGPFDFKHDGYSFEAQDGEWVVVTRRFSGDRRGWESIDMRPATHDEVEAELGPVRWWQWRRRRARRLPAARLVTP